MMLKWDHRYELGHEKIDGEHRLFLGSIVDFHESIARGASKDDLVRILREISNYAAYHFVNEEAVMAACHYPERKQHAQLHRALLAELDDKLSQLVLDGTTPDRVFEFLFRWFALHTSREDKKLVSYIENGAGRRDAIGTPDALT